MQIIDQKQSVAAVLALNKELFVVHLAYFGAKILICLALEAQIALFLTKNINSLRKYIDFSHIFSRKSMAILSKHLNINEYVINLEPDKHPLYKPIYSLGLIELKTFKIYIKTNLANEFTNPSNFLQKHSFFLFKSLIKASVCM